MKFHSQQQLGIKGGIGKPMLLILQNKKLYYRSVSTVSKHLLSHLFLFILLLKMAVKKHVLVTFLFRKVSWILMFHCFWHLKWSWCSAGSVVGLLACLCYFTRKGIFTHLWLILLVPIIKCSLQSLILKKILWWRLFAAHCL